MCNNWPRQAEPNHFFEIRPTQADAGGGGSWGIWQELGGPLGLQAVEESSAEMLRTGLGGYSLCLGLTE